MDSTGSTAASVAEMPYVPGSLHRAGNRCSNLGSMGCAVADGPVDFVRGLVGIFCEPVGGQIPGWGSIDSLLTGPQVRIAALRQIQVGFLPR